MEPEATTSNTFPYNNNNADSLPLLTYLNSCPATFEYRLTESAKQEILKRLFSELWRSNEEYRSLFFPNGFGEGLDAYKLSLALGEGSSEYLPTQKGKACGHVFKKGEGVYRCRNCALDDTCVFCSRCFHATNHDGHDVTFSVNSGSGGCCDCGDPEAWKLPVHCSYHSLDYSSPDSSEFEKIQYEEILPHDLLNPIHNTISTVLDFMLDTLSASPEEMTPPLNDADVRKEANRAALYIRDHVNIVDEEKLFAVVLWNDEHHSFHEVIDQVMDAIECSQAEAKAMAKRVDSYGRDIVQISEDIPRLRSIARTISSIGLAVTIRSARDTFREGMCGLFIDWLKDLAGGKIGSDSSLLRDIICEELCKEWNKPRGADIDMKSKIRFAGDTQNGQVEGTSEYMSDDEEMVMIDDGNDANVEDDTSNVYRQSVEFNGDYDVLMEEHSSDAIEPMDEDESIIYRGTSSLMQKVEDFKKKLRLDKLLILDLRLWKEARAGLRELYIGTLITNTGYKKIMGIRFARNYVKLAKAFLTPDREPEHSIVLFSVQLFTVPTISTILVTKYKFLTTIFTILHTFFTSNTVGEDLDSIDPNAKIDCDSDAFKNRRYFHVFQDLRYIISNDAVKIAIPKNPHYLQQYLNLIALFQGMNPNIRATQQHVEYENDSWVNAFNVTLQIAKSCRQFSDCYTGNTRTLCITIRKTLRKLYEWCSRCDDDDDEGDKMDETGDDHEESLYHSSAWVTSTPGSYGPFTKSAKFSDERNEDKDNNLSSLREPEFHDVIFPANPYFLSFRVVKFEVSSQPVSFHHPLNWFLAELLENVNLLDDELLKQHGFGSFQSMMMGFDFENNEELGAIVQRVKEKILGVFDYPLRVLVLLVQIRAGLWVRNGFGIRGQCHHYREISLRENTYDEDIFLLQTAFILLDPNIVLVTILDRFDLVEWFNGRTNHKVYDNSQLTFIAEELLTLLITCVSERANAAGLTNEQKIRREIIHGLCLGPIAYSELIKRIPERLAQDPMFDEILTRLTTYKSPDSLTDHGTYELYDEYFDEVDPYFVHYSRNNREEAEEALKNRLKKKDANSNPLLMPKLTPITSGPYVKLGNILHASLLNQIIYYSLWHVKTDEKIKSDTLVEEALHLIMLALLDENNDIMRECKRKGKQKATDTSISSDIDEEIPGFVYYAVSDHFQEIDTSAMKSQGTSLLDLLLQLSCDQSFKEFHNKLEFIINKFEQFESDSAKLTINRYREKLRIDLQSKGTEESKVSEYERKKQAAKERQKKIMEQFAKAQQSFIEKHEELYDEYEGMEEDWDLPAGEEQSGTNSLKTMETNWSYPTGTCIVCQEETNSSSLYGMLGLIQPSSLLRHTPFNDEDYIVEVDDLPESLDFKYDRSIPFGVASSVYTKARPLSKGFPSKSCRQGLYASTCGHLMHVKCFDTYFASLEQRHSLQLARNHPEDVKRKEFMCPLCKSLGNILLPIVWKVKKEVFPGILETQEDYVTWLRDKVGSGLDKLNLILPSGSDLPYSNTDPNRRYTPFTAGAPFDSATNVDFSTYVQTSQTQPRRRNSSGAGRIREAITHIVHMLRNPAAIQNSDENGPSIAASDDFQPLHGSSRVDAHVSSDDDQENIRRMYNRLADVMQMTYQKITTEITFQTNSLKSIEHMWDLFGYTISCIEIGQRGISHTISEGSIGSTLVDGINSQTLTLLRILSETILTYMDTMLIGQNSEFGLKQVTTYRIQQIFYGHPSFQQENSAQVVGSTPLVNNTRKIIGLFGPSLQFTKVKPLLLEDPFLVLVEICMYTVSVVEYDVYHMMRLLYTAEIVKVIVSLVESAVNVKTNAWEENERFKKKFPDLRDPQGFSIRDFIIWVTRRVGNNEQDIVKFLDKIDESAFVKLIRKFCLPYLRKCVILLHARFGVVFPIGTDDLQTQNENEFVSLSKFLGFPSIEQICSISSDITMSSVISGWCNHLFSLRQAPPLPMTSSGTLNDTSMIHDVHVSSGVASSSSQVPQQNHQSYQRIDVKVNHPAIFELVGLPKRLDSLFEESLKKVCEKCKTVPHDPALCLLCGTFVCSQSYCCSENDRGLENDRGECNLHTKSCGGEIGIYLLVKRCVILLLHVDNGCYMNAPYLDRHGEVDLGLKRGKPQFLSQKRYDEIRKLWLTHGVPIHVARKIEQAFDLGGWPTF